MKRVYTHSNPSMVGLAKSMLENSGLEVMLKNEFLNSGIPPYNADQELWVLDDGDYDTALELLDGLVETNE